jgi:tRNA(fMet)-specific endonuclease VapC
MSKVLLDTNAYTALFRGSPAVLAVIARAERVYASVIVIGELEAGFRGGSKYAENTEMLERLLAKPAVAVLPVTRDTSDCFGLIKEALRRKGIPLPINDLWIAAQSMETGSVLVTYDRHFLAVDGLRIWDGISADLTAARGSRRRAGR